MLSVLIVEDDPANREAFSKVLRRDGFEVTTAENGVAALDILAHQSFNAVVSDFAMPELSGRGFYEQLEEQFPDIAGRVVFVTAYAEDPRIRSFLNQTGQPVLAKPVEIEALLSAVRQIAARPSGGYRPAG